MGKISMNLKHLPAVNYDTTEIMRWGKKKDCWRGCSSGLQAGLSGCWPNYKLKYESSYHTYIHGTEISS